MERGICPIAAVCTVLLSRSRDPGQANVSETFIRCHVGTIPGNTRAKFEVRVFSLFGTIDNQGALGVGARGQDRLTESSGSLNDV